MDKCIHCIGEIEKNEIGEEMCFCELTDKKENITLGDCIGNCVSQHPIVRLKAGYHWECKYCDGMTPVQSPYEEKGFMVCLNCGAEWEDCKILVPDEEY